MTLRPSGRRLQAGGTEAILPRSGLRHGQAKRGGVTPAVAAEAAVKGRAATRADQLPWQEGFAQLHQAIMPRLRHCMTAYGFGSPPKKPAIFQLPPSLT